MSGSASAGVPAAATSQAGPSRGGRYRHRRPRKAGPQDKPPDGPNTPPSSQDTALPQPAPVTPRPSIPSQPNAGRGARGSGRGRGRGRRGGPVMGIGGRTFGGQLTTSIQPQGSLQADAPVFTPGQPLTARPHPPPRTRRMSKSIAPDIASRTHEDISNGLYECPICTSEVLRNSKVWSCKTCWTVFHMSCIKKWSKNEGSTQQQRQPDGEMPPPRQWRCPGCNLPKDDLPTNYTCWCAKEIDPKQIPGLPPHSCGQTCSKPRAPRKCPHPCELLCHAGPCPPCSHIGPTMSCFCGKNSVAKRCIETNYDSGWSCDGKCGDIMPCGEHECDRPCHEGLCGSCEVMVEARCYCGKVEKLVACSERAEEKESQTTETWIGTFDCGQNCERIFDCGKHSCTKRCHEQTSSSHCPFSPDVVSHCPCGKTPLLQGSRSSCEDKIPHCEKTCNRVLPCGHMCQQTCHAGECRPCLETVSIKCRCGRTSSSTVCHQGLDELPQCARACRALLNCGRHECGERCCAAEAIAGERLAKKRKARSNAVRQEDIEAEHICTRTCGRSLKCGDPNHVCQELCHRGPCGTCREATFYEIPCNCGRTVLQPPLACGTQPPPCQFQCNRPKHCGHPQVQHNCHIDESCPKCPYLVEKPCMCGKKALKNQPCWSQSINCGQVCGRRLKCGIHYCKKPCHRPGECEDTGKSCPQQCGQKKTAAGCGHPCLESCHAPYPCKEDKPCQAKIIITCECQNQKQESRCLATKMGEEVPRKTLQCNDECLRLQRNQKLAMALNIQPDHTDDHIPYSTTTLDMFKVAVKFCQAQEREFRVFAADPEEKRLRFKPMPASQRAFVHALAEDFGLDSESMDPEPHRHVAIFKTPRFVSAPMKTLGQCLKIKTIAEARPVTSSAIITEPYNALILSNPRFALTIEELKTELNPEFAALPPVVVTISFLPSEEIVLYGQGQPLDEATCIRLKPLVSKTILGQQLASSVALCRVDQSLNVTRREEDISAGGGWSQVVKGAAKAKIVSQESAIGDKSAFTVLGSKLVAKKAQESVVDNWESAVDGWE